MQIIIIFILIVVLTNFIKSVPASGAVIIDRNDHYLKTKKRGFYYFNPATDKVTTTISTFPITQTYTQFSESHDSNIFQNIYSVTYKVSNVEHVLESLKSNRRSVNDIIQSCVQTSFFNFETKDIKNPSELIEEIRRRLSVNLESFEITLISFDLHPPIQVAQSARKNLFKPHISEGIRSIKFK